MLALLAFFSVVWSARAESSESNWKEAAAPARLVFVRPSSREHFCLLSAPARMAAVPVSGGKAWCGASACPVRLVWAGATDACFLVDCRNVSEQEEVALYLLTNAAASKADANVADPRPVRFYAQRTAGQDLPATREQLQILDTRVDRDPFYQSLADFEVDEDSVSGWYRGDWQRKNHLFQVSSWMLFPTAGRYVFGLRSEQPVWLTVDGQAVLEHHASRHVDWATGRPQMLAAGLHEVVARGVTKQDLRLSAGWSLEGRKDAPGVVAVTGGEMVRARLERRDRRLHAFAVATAGHPYSFEGATNVFLPVQLESRSVSWDGYPCTCSWRLDGRELGTGRCLKTVLCAGSVVGRVDLTVTDNHGNTAQDTVMVALDTLSRNQYRVSGRLVGVPAVGYEEDPVRPEIHVRATSPDDVDFTVEAAIEHVGGGVTTVTGQVDIVRSWGRLALPAATADAYSRIDWRVVHGGVPLDRGSLAFDRAPFRNLPDTLDGETLCVRTQALMLVARRASVGEPTAFEGVRHGQRLLLLDGFLAPADGSDSNLVARLDMALGGSNADGWSGGAGANSASPAVAPYRHVDLRAMESACAADGVGRLLPLAQVGALLPTDVVVVAPSFDALGQGETLAQFERRLAALVGLLSGPGRATVVLVTPPPFAIVPGCEGLAATGVRPPDARQLAELVCRVADAHGMPVIDLYTSFMTAGDSGAALTRDGALTAAGMEQAMEVLRRALFGR